MTQPIILAIDTCEGVCSAALVREGQALASRMERIGRGHAERLLPLIEELLAEAAAGYADLGCIAVCVGPGTFTGLRIGLSVARGMALANDVPCVGLMSLPVLAAQAQAEGHADPVHAIVMGRGGQGFYQAFDGVADNGLPQPITEAGCFDGDDIATRINRRPGLVVGSGADLVGAPHAINAVDPVTLARLSVLLDPLAYLPEPAYLRDADAKKAKAILPVQQ